ncbi:RluA family pseudouridine synthase [Vulgatibacter incomptus]|uniref:Pseudouridine synthase n=1 Tax=Vulgatibacter incomptus TaxID=1391653 RepID=A0A0K1PBS2_9BACT|nr:RluA family pseudouridine synthase [Vulgatibacter incomptus]AKU90947.1 Ribosomal large subunit pseudouridine synthase D [Vulgatibacter incomptus]
MKNRGFSYRETIDRRGAGHVVLDWLAASHQHSSRETWQERIHRGEVELDERPATEGDRLAPGQVLVWHRPAWDEPEVPRSFEVLFEDEAILAVSKPSGLPTMPAGGFYLNTLWSLVRERDPEASPCHRLGRGTSGIVLFTRTASASAALSATFRDRGIRKVYRTLAEGAPPWAELDIAQPIGPVEHARLGTIHAASPSGKAARSRVHVLERRGDAFLADVEIETGRPHQIRIHLAWAGHPLVGDPLYLRGGVPRPDALPGDEGYALHALRVGFPHPSNGDWTEIEAPAPAGLLTRAP